MAQRDTYPKKRLVGNDMSAPRNLKPTVKQKPKTLVKPILITDMRSTKKRTTPKLPVQKIKQFQQPVKSVTRAVDTPLASQKIQKHQPLTIPKSMDLVTDERNINQTFINAVAYDTLIIVVLGYVAFISRWIIYAIVIYAIVVIIFKFGSRRMFISAGICLALTGILKILNRPMLTRSFTELTVFFLLVASTRMVIEYYITKRTKN
jgi:hypothetical protein